MKKITLILFLVLSAIWGINAQEITLPYFEDFSSLTAGDMESATGSTTAVATYPANITSVVEAYQAGQVMMIGSSSNVGSFTTQPVNSGTASKVRVAFRAVPFAETTPLAVQVSITYGSQSKMIDIPAVSHSWPLTATDMVQYSAVFDAEATASVVMLSTVAGANLENRLFIDDFKISSLTPGVPLYEGFEGTAFPPVDWVAIHETGTVSWERRTYSGDSPIGTASAAVSYGTSAGNSNWLITPQMNPIVGQNFSFKIKTSTYYSGTKVYIKLSTTDNLVASFDTTLLTLENRQQITRSWQEYSVDLSAWAGSSIYVAFHVEDHDGMRILIDEVNGGNLKPIPCPTPISLDIQNITPNSANVNWVENGSATNWVVEYATNPTFDQELVSQEASGVPNLTITGLNPNKLYYVRVKADCLGGDVSSYAETMFRTGCEATDPFTYLETFSASSKDQFDSDRPLCWTRLVSYNYTATNIYPKVVLSNSHDDTSEKGSLKMYASATTTPTENVIATPQFASPLAPMNVRFWLKRTSNTASTFEVGAISDLNDLSTYITVQTVDIPTAQNEWVENVISLENVPNTHNFLVLKAKTSTDDSFALHIDEFRVERRPTCFPPTSFEATNVTDNSMTVSWVPDANAGGSEWIFEYRKRKDSVWSLYSPNPTTPTCTLTGLEPSSTYMFRVKSICSAVDSSFYSEEFMARTNCVDITALNETFAGYPTVDQYLIPDCWTKYSIDNKYPAIIAPSNSLGLNSEAIQFGNSKPQFLILPRSATALNQFMLKFKLNQEGSYCGLIQVGYMSSPTDTTTFVPVASIDNGSEYKIFVDKKVYLNKVADDGSNRYVAFRYGDKSDRAQSTFYSYWLDDVEFAALPSCLPAVSVDISNVMDVSVKATIVPNGNETNWQYVYTSDANVTDPNTLTPVDVTSLEFTINGLTASTPYKLWVRAKCSDTDFSEWIDMPVNFTTICAPIGIPFVENFDGLTSKSIPDCWAKITTNLDYPGVVSASSSNGLPSNAIRFSGSKPQYLISPKYNMPLSELRLKFKLNKEGKQCGDFQVGYMSSSVDASTFVPVATFNDGTFKQLLDKQVLFTNVVDDGDNRYIAFRYGDTDNAMQDDAWYYWIDDINVDILPSCLSVTALSVVETFTDSVKISFTNNTTTATTWQYVVTDDLTVTDPTTLTPVDITAVPATITGLNPNTKYKVWVRTKCSDTDLSEWQSTMFRTDCLNNISTLTENFQTSNPDEENRPYCWTRACGYYNYPYVYTSKGNSDNTSLYFYTSTNDSVEIISTNAFDTPISQLEVVFWLLRANIAQGSKFEVGVMSNPNDSSTFIPIQDVTPTAENWTECTVNMQNAPATHTYVSFRLTNTNSGYRTYYLDDLDIHIIPTCAKPSGLDIVAGTLTSDGVTISWTPNGTETEWTLEYKKLADTDWTPVAVSGSPSYQLTGLESNTPYEVRVKALCVAGSDESIYTVSTKFQTECGIITLPFTENFDGQEMPPSVCWGRYKNFAAEIFSGAQFTDGGRWYRDDAGDIKLNLYGTYHGWLVTPSIQLQGDVKLTMDLALTEYSSSGPANQTGLDDKFMIVVSTDDGATWSEDNAIVWSNDGNGDHVLNDISNTSTSYTVDLSQYSGTIKIGFYAESTETNADNYLRVDNISIVEVEVVPPTVETQAADNITDNTATLHKQVTQGSKPIDSEGFYYRAVNTSAWANSTDGMLTGLSAGTTYEFYAYAVVGSETYSGDTLTLLTTGTSVVHPTITTLDAEAITQTTATLKGSFVADQSEPIVLQGWKYKKPSESNWVVSETGNLTGLNANTLYEFFAYATTGLNTTGYEGVHKTFTTLSHTAPTVTTEDATAVTTNSATLNKTVVAGTEEILSQGWEYRIVGTNQWFASADGNLIDLVANTAYEFYAYATTADFPKTKGDIKTFTTLNASTGIDLADYGVVLYPNPAKEIVNIVVDGLLSDADITIVNMQGKVVGRHTMTVGQKQLSVDVSDYATGNYFVKINSNGNTKVARLIVK